MSTQPARLRLVTDRRSTERMPLDIESQLNAAYDGLRLAVGTGNHIAIQNMADAVRDLSRLVAEAKIADICATRQEPFLDALQAIGVAPHLILKDVSIPVDGDDIGTAVSTDGTVMAFVEERTPRRWKVECDKIRATGQCPRCKSKMISLENVRSTSISSVPAYVCFDCDYEIPYAE